mgnify:CR=1 FL=1
MRKNYYFSWWINILFVMYLYGTISFIIIFFTSKSAASNLQYIGLGFGLGLLAFFFLLPTFIIWLIGFSDNTIKTNTKLLNIPNNKSTLVWFFNIWYLIIVIKYLNQNKIDNALNKYRENNKYFWLWNILQVIYIAMTAYLLALNGINNQVVVMGIIASVCQPISLILMFLLFYKYIKQMYYALQLGNEYKKIRIMSFIPIVNCFVYLKKDVSDKNLSVNL